MFCQCSHWQRSLRSPVRRSPREPAVPSLTRVLRRRAERSLRKRARATPHQSPKAKAIRTSTANTSSRRQKLRRDRKARQRNVATVHTVFRLADPVRVRVTVAFQCGLISGHGMWICMAARRDEQRRVFNCHFSVLPRPLWPQPARE